MSARVRYEHDDVEDQGLFTNRSTMMANFEEWIKMATDNKINSRNSWNFALIDYFHDLNVLRDSENNINFQKASATLDGCVKIYSSRVDSVTTETGKLLSGLAQKKLTEKQEKANAANAEGGEDQASDDSDGSEAEIQIDPSTGLPIANNAAAQTKRWNHNRVLETTLVDFETIKMKELDQELNIDPLFKKALVDFDEGGAKSLLLNTLNIDKDARVVFDAAMKENNKKEVEGTEDHDSRAELASEIGDESESAADMDSLTNAESAPSIDDATNTSAMVEDEVLALGMDFIKFTDISNSVISQSMQQLPKVFEDLNKAKNFIDGINSKFDNFLSEKELEEAVPDLGYEVDGNGEMLEDGINEPNENYSGADVEPNDEDPAGEGEDASLTDEGDRDFGGVFEQELMAYFDENLTKTWRGREHWKVQNFKRKNALSGNEIAKISDPNQPSAVAGVPEDSKKKKKGPFEIDFFALDDKFEEAIFASKKRANIDLPQKSRTNESHYLLPDDFHFTTQKITRLFIKPEQTMSLFQPRRRKRDQAFAPELSQNANLVDKIDGDDGEVAMADEHFWAENYQRKEHEDNEEEMEEPEQIVGAGPENPFEDDGGVDFNQAFDDEEFKDGGPSSMPVEEPGRFPFADNKVNFSRVSKKVDVKKLKDNIWNSIKVLKDESREKIENGGSSEEVILRFTDVAVEIGKRYTVEARKDISTSFCFICLLHLANEHGLEINNTENFEDLSLVLK